MKPLVYKIQNNNLSVAFKGYTIPYNGATKIKHWCKGVEKTYADAERNAKKLIKKLKHEKTQVQ